MKPYVKRQKNDAADAEAICEAVQRPSMRFVPTKTPEQQSCLMLHRTRHLFIRHQTAIINTIRAHRAEFGIVAPVGRNGVEDLLYAVADQRDERIPEVARAVSKPWARCSASSKSDFGVRPTDQRMASLERDEPPSRRAARSWSCARNRTGRQCRRSEGVPIGPRLLGLDWFGPEQFSSGGREKLGSITKQGDRYLRSLFTAGALAVIRYAKIHGAEGIMASGP